MAGTARRIVVEFLGEDKSLGKQMADIDGKSHKLSATLGKVGKAAALGLAAGIGAATVAGVKFAQAAAEDEQAAKLLEGALKRNAGASKEQVATVESWISAQGRATGVTDDELRPALSRLVTATKDVTRAQELARLAMEVSAGTGKSLESVSTALMKAENGQVSALSRLGINTKNAAGETITMDEAVRRMGDTFAGAAAEKANTFQGKMDRLKLILPETGEEIGAKLLPVVASLADWFLAKGLPAISAFGGWAEANLLPILRNLANWVQDSLLPALRNIGDWIGTHVLPMFQKLGAEGPSIFAKVREAIEPVIQTVISIAQNVGNKLRPVFEQLVETFRSQVLPTLKVVIDRFVDWWPAISKVVSKIADLGATIIGTVLPPVIKFAGFMLSTLVPVILDVIEVLGKIIGKVWDVGSAFVNGVADVAKFVGGIREKINNALEVIGGLPGKAVEAIGNLGQTLWNAGSALIQGLIDGITSKISALKDKLGSITKMIPDLKGPLDKDKILLQPAGAALIEGLINGIEKKKTKLATALTKITDYIKKKQDALAALLDKRQAIVDSFRGFASSIFGANIAPTEEGAPSGLDAILAASSTQRARAEQLNRDVAALISKGLSQDLINQLVAAGESGMDQISLLAQATAEQIRAVNDNNAATQEALRQAGIKAADAVMAEQIAAAQRDVALADGIRDKLKELLDQQDKNTIVQLVLDGKVLQVSLLKLKKSTGKPLGLG